MRNAGPSTIPLVQLDIYWPLNSSETGSLYYLIPTSLQVINPTLCLHCAVLCIISIHTKNCNIKYLVEDGIRTVFCLCMHLFLQASTTTFFTQCDITYLYSNLFVSSSNTTQAPVTGGGNKKRQASQQTSSVPQTGNKTIVSSG